PRVPPPGHVAVEGEADRVQDAGLAGAGGADQGEEVRVGEVDRGLLPEHPEPGQVQPQRPHAPVTPSASTSSYSSAHSPATASSACPRAARYSELGSAS